MSVFISKQLTVPSLDKDLSDYAVGESVFLNVNGVKTEFLIVHQGLPSSDYDASCDGTWLLMKDLYEKRVWDSSDNDYANSDIHAYLNNTFVNLFDSSIKSIIKQVKIPYREGTSGIVVSYGSKGLSTKVFLLSCTELGFRGGVYYTDGAVLDYFDDTSNVVSKRIAYYNGTAGNWWTRSPFYNVTSDIYNTTHVEYVNLFGGGNATDGTSPYSYYVRPALVLPYDTLFDPDTNEVIV